MTDAAPATAPLSCFKAYDVRGRLGVDLDADIARRIGRAFAEELAPGRVVTGRDCRESSPALQAALNEGLRDGGADVIEIGLCGTEEVYFATDHLAAGGGIMVTASHNPADYNGMKLVQA
ncbi:MAG: phosphomannomutase CpsG, partial [Spirochaetes bacterium]|nr:phosphomannomutase CpsG [Spirochaetota bacterium]